MLVWKFEIVFKFVQKTLYWDCICVNSAYYNVAVFVRKLLTNPSLTSIQGTLPSVQRVGVHRCRHGCVLLSLGQRFHCCTKIKLHVDFKCSVFHHCSDDKLRSIDPQYWQQRQGKMKDQLRHPMVISVFSFDAVFVVTVYKNWNEISDPSLVVQSLFQKSNIQC